MSASAFSSRSLDPQTGVRIKNGKGVKWYVVNRSPEHVIANNIRGSYFQKNMKLKYQEKEEAPCTHAGFWIIFIMTSMWLLFLGASRTRSSRRGMEIIRGFGVTGEKVWGSSLHSGRHSRSSTSYFLCVFPKGPPLSRFIERQISILPPPLTHTISPTRRKSRASSKTCNYEN